MTKKEAKIIELFQSLTVKKQEEMLDRLTGLCGTSTDEPIDLAEAVANLFPIPRY